MDDTVLLHHDHDVAVVTLNRPDKLNAWTGAMRARLVEVLHRLGDDPDCGAIVITGAGRAFCAGQDLAETAAIDADDRAASDAWIDDFDRLYRALRGVDKPTVAALNGVVAGSGFQFALLADLRIGHPGVRIGQPEVLSGIPSITGIWAMWDVLGRTKTTELALTGELLDGAEAQRLGLITRLVDEADVLPAALEQAHRLAELPPGAVALTKRRIRELDDASLSDAIDAAKRVHGTAYSTGEPQREMARFLAGHRR
ncbi:MAG: enoyl-CoA hydratase/isomerase family protein [Actinocatenispora sp.]